MPLSLSSAGLVLTGSYTTIGAVCPNNTGQMVRLMVANTVVGSFCNVNIKVHLVATGSDYVIALAVPVYAQQTRLLDAGIALTPGDYISLEASTASQLTAYASIMNYTTVPQLAVANAGLLLTTSANTVYTCPSGKSAIVRIFVGNVDPAGYLQLVTIKVFNNATNSTYVIANNAPIAPNLTKILDMPINLNAGDQIIASAGASNVLTLFASIMVNG